jgi:hypothetical protein
MTTATVSVLAPPSSELVERALRSLEYDERLIGYAMTPSAGNAAKDLYSLGDAVLFVLGTKWDAPLFDPSFKGGINWVDLSRMTDWVRDVIGDADLAEAMERDVLPLSSYMAQVIALGDVFGHRMEQYRALRGEIEAGDAPAE